MKQRSLRQVVGGLGAALWVSLASLAFALEPGAVAPGFTLEGQKGPIRLEQYAGKVVYLDFWASWCGPCRQSFPWMNGLQAKYGDKGFVVLAINLDTNREDAAKFLAQVKADFTIAYDPQGLTPRQYGVKGMPTSYLIDRQGKLVAQHVGFNSGSREALEAQLHTQFGTKP